MCREWWEKNFGKDKKMEWFEDNNMEVSLYHQHYYVILFVRIQKKKKTINYVERWLIPVNKEMNISTIDR